MDDGNQGNFSTIFTTHQETEHTVENVTRGNTYRFQYRIRTSAGYSEYSDISYIMATEAPAKPSAPQFVSANDTSISIKVFSSNDSRGVDVERYEIWRDAGNNLASSFTNESSYDGQSLDYVITSGLGTPASTYRIKVRAVNKDGM